MCNMCAVCVNERYTCEYVDTSWQCARYVMYGNTRNPYTLWEKLVSSVTQRVAQQTHLSELQVYATQASPFLNRES